MTREALRYFYLAMVWNSKETIKITLNDFFEEFPERLNDEPITKEDCLLFAIWESDNQKTEEMLKDFIDEYLKQIL